mmetsp:Transcript_43542/g.102629  ORF Transcript_43542/g.102629 Transcript_43542/m.102629 type:complete len:218 (-) Transcript_43542:521-1174(-)
MSHCGITLISAMIPTVTADVRLVSQVKFTWKSSKQKLSTSSSWTPSHGYCCNATHQAGLESGWSSPCLDRVTVPLSRKRERQSAVTAENEIFQAVNSIAVIPPMRFLGFISSLTPFRRKVTVKASAIGVSMFTRSGKKGTAAAMEASKLMMIAPKELSHAPTLSNLFSLSPFTNRAKRSVQTKSVDCKSKCVGAGTVSSPQLVTANFTPNMTPTGAV